MEEGKSYKIPIMFLVDCIHCDWDSRKSMIGLSVRREDAQSAEAALNICYMMAIGEHLQDNPRHEIRIRDASAVDFA